MHTEICMACRLDLEKITGKKKVDDHTQFRNDLHSLQSERWRSPRKLSPYASGMKVNRTTYTKVWTVHPRMYFDIHVCTDIFPRPSSTKFSRVISPNRSWWMEWYKQYPICRPFRPHQTRMKRFWSRAFLWDLKKGEDHPGRVSTFSPLTKTSSNSR